MTTAKTPHESDGATVTEDYMRPRFEGEVIHQRLSRCRTCWTAVWSQDEERHTAWHRGALVEKP